MVHIANVLLLDGMIINHKLSHNVYWDSVENALTFRQPVNLMLNPDKSPIDQTRLSVAYMELNVPDIFDPDSLVTTFYLRFSIHPDYPDSMIRPY